MKTRLHVHDALESELVLIGGDDREGLAAAVAGLLDYLARAPRPVLRDIALTTGLAAREAIARAAVVAATPAELTAKLKLLRRRLEDPGARLSESKDVYTATALCPAPGRMVFVFPGEGSQYPDMLRDLCLNFPACRSAFDDADTACAAAGAAILPSQWIFPAGEQPEDAVAEGFGTAAAVQAVIAANTALLRLFTQLGIVPDAVVGAGVGEIAALECAGVISFDTRRSRIRALREGYELMQKLEASPQIPSCVCLAVSGIDRAALDACLRRFGDDVAVAREHGAGFHGLCVRPAAAAPLRQAIAAAGGTARVLPLRQPYHTPWMEPARAALSAFFTRLIAHPPRLPVYSCMTAAPHEGAPADWAAAAAAKWARPLRFAETIERLHADGYRVFVEIGARGSLTAAIGAVLQHRPHLAVAANRVHRAGVPQLHHALAALAVHGQRVDVAPLHVNRGSRLVDLSRPRQARRSRVARDLLLPATLPSLRGATIPDGLVAPAAPPPAGLRAAPPADRSRLAGDDGRTDFPLLLDAVTLAETPGESIRLALRLSVPDLPFLADSALGTNQVSLSERTLRGLPLMPLGMLAELMAEAARRLAPALTVTEVAGLTYDRWLTVEGSDRAIQVVARRLPGDGTAVFRVETLVQDHDPDAPREGGGIARALITLAESCPPPPAARPPALRCPAKIGWQGADIYPARLHHGPLFQNLPGVPLRGENGLVADWVALPRGGLLRRAASPRFSLDPVLLEAIGAALALWHARTPADGRVHLPAALDSLRLHAPPLAEWTRGRLNLFLRKPEGQTVCADAELLDDEGRVLLSAGRWRNRVFEVDPALHRLLLNPAENHLTEELPAEALPALPQEVVCCMARHPGARHYATDDELWLRVIAHLALSLTERLKWREMGGSTARRAEWLLGRAAAKDAVRRCLLARYGRRWAAADIRIETDEAGKPRPQGEWRRHCGARMDLSIAHTADRIVAAVAPNACLGIDIERRDRVISDEFAAAAFGLAEQEIAAESGEGPTALFRFWCAKEAVAKALGTGLRFGAADLKVRSFDRSGGRVAMELTRLWLQAFPHLRGSEIMVHTCLLDNLVMAVCVLDPALVEGERTSSP